MKRDEFDLFDDRWSAPQDLDDDDFLADAPERRSRGGKGVLIAVIVVAGIAVAIGAAFWAGRANRVEHEAETRQERQRETREAFSATRASDFRQPADPQTLRELQRFFQDFSKAVKSGDNNEIERHINGRRILDELIAQGVPRRDFGDLDAFSRRLTGQLATTMSQNADAWDYSNVTIRFVRERKSASEALVYLRIVVDDVRGKVRVWMTRESGRWMLFDTEALDEGLRMSRIMVGFVQALRARPGDLADVQAQTRAMQNLMIAMRARDLDALRRETALANFDRLPVEVAALLPLARMAVCIEDEKWEDALSNAKSALRLNPDMSIVHYSRATIYNQLERYPEAEASARKFLHELGDDADAYIELSAALVGQKKNEEAVAALRKGLLDDPDSADCLVELAVLLKKEQKPEIGRYFAKMPRAKKQFALVAGGLLADEDFDALDEVLKSQRKIDPGNPLNGYFRAEVEFGRENYAESMAAAEPGLSKLTDADERRECIRVYLNAAYILEKPVEAYQKVSQLDPKYAFEFLAIGMVRDSRIRELKELTEIHRKRFPDFTNRDRIEAEFAYSESRWGDAASGFRKALKSESDEDEISHIQHRLIDALTYDDKPQAAYNELAPSKETFRRIAARIQSNSRTGPLEKLIGEHRKRFPDDVWLNYYAAKVKMQRDKYAAVFQLIERVLPKVKEQRDRAMILRLFHESAYLSDRWPAAMKTSPSPKESFSYFAGELISHHRTSDFKKLLAGYATAHAADPNIEFYSGMLAEKEERLDDAERHYRAAWNGAAEEPAKNRSRYALVRVLLELGQGLKAYRTVTPPKSVFTQVASFFDRKKQSAKLTALLKEHKPQEANDYWTLYYRIRLLLLQKNYKAAVDRIHAARKTVTPEWRSRSLRDMYFECMVEQGKGVEAYRQAKDRGRALDTLCSRMRGKKQYASLNRLLALHHKDHPKDIRYYQNLARIAETQEDWEKAIGHYRDGLKLDDGKSYWSVRGPLVRAYYRAGQPFVAYREVKPTKQTFDRLARLLVDDSKPEPLEKLIGLHATKHSSDPAVSFWRAEAFLLKKDYKSVISTIRAKRVALLNDKTTAWRTDHMLVYAYLHLKQIDEAEKVVRRPNKPWQDSWLEALLAAARKDPRALRFRLMQILDDDEYSIEDIYRDAILGPTLRSPAMSALRKQFPPSVDEKSGKETK